MSAHIGGIDRTYRPNATDPSRVVAFDTDMTIDYAGGPIPLSHVTDLRDGADTLVWATGFNQTLRKRAGIPGMFELKKRRDIGVNNFIARPDRMRLLKREFPDADEYIVADDVDLRELEPAWRYYQPAEYVVDVLDIPAERWPAELDITAQSYLADVGRFEGQLPSHEVDMDGE